MNLKVLAAILIVGVIAVAIPVTIKLSQSQTQLKSQASEGQCSANGAQYNTGEIDYALCRACQGDGSWGPNGSDWGTHTGSGEWCACARAYAGASYNTDPQYTQCGGGPGSGGGTSGGGSSGSGGSGGTTQRVCTPDAFDPNSCRRCASDGSRWGANGSDFGPQSNQAQWCSCARTYAASTLNTDPQYAACRTGGGSGGGTAAACTANAFDAQRCARCAGDGSRWGDNGSDYGPIENKTQWCSCAQRNASDYSTSATYSVCRGAGGTGDGGAGAGTGAGTGDQGAGGAGLAEGSTCKYTITNTAGTDVTSRGPIYGGDQYRVRIEMTNTAKDATTPTATWTPSYKLSLSSTPTGFFPTDNMSLTESVAKGETTIFQTEVTAPQVPEGNFATVDYKLKMRMVNDKAQEFGAACIPQQITIQRKPAGPVSTKCYVLSDDTTKVANVTSCDFNNPLVHKYSENPITFAFSDASAGVKNVYVKFFNQDNQPSQVYTKAVSLSPAASISSVACSYSSNGPGTQFIINGANLGNSGTVKVGNQTAQIPSGGWTPIAINATIDQRLEGNTRLTITPDGGSAINADCTVNTTTFTFTAKNQCREDGLFTGNDLDVKVYEAGEEPIFNQKVKLDNEGKPSGFAPKLEKGKNYTLVVKATGTLAKKKEFKTGNGGTTILEPFTLPVGDIAPKNAPDGVINNLDASELKRQWALTGSTTKKNGDFNDDGAVNSLDYSCLRLNFNARDENFSPPAGGSTSAPSSSGNTGVGPSNSNGSGSQTATQTNLTLSADTTSPKLNSKLVFRGTLKDSAGNPIANKSIKLINSSGDTFIKDSASDADGSHPTDTNGSYIIVLTISTLDQFRAYAKFDGDSTYATSQSQPVSITPRPADE